MLNVCKDKNSFIGVFDSGLGGISVLRKMVEIMPNEDFVYFGDSKNAPYGTKTIDEVRHLTTLHIETLMKQGAKAICIACNTATSAAAKYLRQKYPDYPLVGIEPAIKPAVLLCHHPDVLVMATPMTIREEKFQNLLSRFESDANIYQLPCPGLMEFIENGILSGPRLEEFLNELLADYKNTHLDAVVLGCTHYPFVSEQIQKSLGGSVQVFDGSLGTAKELKRRLQLSDLTSDKSNGRVTITNSDPEHIELGESLLQHV